MIVASARRAAHVSKSYSRSQWKNKAESIRDEWGVELIPFKEAGCRFVRQGRGRLQLCGGRGDLDGVEYGWRLSNVRSLKRRVACTGALKLWTMDKKLTDEMLKVQMCLILLGEIGKIGKLQFENGYCGFADGCGILVASRGLLSARVGLCAALRSAKADMIFDNG